MNSLNQVLSDLDTLRYAAAGGDAVRMFADMGITTREQVAERLGLHVDNIPEMSELTKALGVPNVNFGCCCVSGDTPCGAPAVRAAMAGCVHEHVAPVWLCAGHDAIGFDSGDKGCFPCREMGHECLLAEIVNRPFSEEWLIDALSGGAGKSEQERAELREFWHANLRKLVPPHLREAS